VINPAPLEIDGTAYAPGQTALSSSDDGTLKLWNLSTGEALRTLQGHTKAVRSVAINPAPLEIDGTTYSPGQIALSGSDDGTLKLWDLSTGQVLHTSSMATHVLWMAWRSAWMAKTALSGSKDRCPDTASEAHACRDGEQRIFQSLPLVYGASPTAIVAVAKASTSAAISTCSAMTFS
jgi:hypothetical protein